MDTNLPEPMTGADCDLRGMPYMPLDIVRLFDSDLYALSSGDEFKAALTLWGKAFLQVPAGSLPSDDRILAHLSGAGVRWAKLRPMALRGWVLCSDGRLYHPVVSEKARDAWRIRCERRTRTEAARRARHTAKNEPEQPAAEALSGSVTTSVTENVTERPDVTVTGSKRSKVKGTEERKEEAAPRRATKLVVAKPTLNDDPPAWFGLADKTEVDREGIERPVVGGSYLDVIAFKVCELAEMNGHSKPLDWQPLIGWLRDDIDPETQIYPAIRRIATRRGYSPPRFLSYFDNAVRTEKAA